MPYVDEVERLVAFGRSANAPPGAEPDGFFADMVVDPVATLQEFEPRQIVFVITGEGPAPELPPGGTPQGPPDRKLSWKVTGRGRPPRSQSIGQGAVVVRDPVFDILGSGAVGGWRLIPYVDRVADKVVDDFRHAAEVLLEWARGSFARRVSDPAVRRDLVTHDRSKMARAYRHAFGDKNATSLSL